MATNYNKPKLNRKEWQGMQLAPVATSAATFFMGDITSRDNTLMYVTSATSQFLYYHDEDNFVPIPSAALAGTFGAGACGTYYPWSITYTANGGSTTSVTVAAATHNITGIVIGKTIEFISAGTASGERRTITSVDLSGAGAGTLTLYFDTAVSTAILNTHTFRIASGSYFVMNAGTIAAGIFKRYDVATIAWQASLATTNLPATWATDGKLTSFAAEPGVLLTKTATGGTTTTLALSTALWDTDVYKNRTLMIISGTGKGQIATITSNTSNTLNFSALTTAPDATSVFQIITFAPYTIGVATATTATTLSNAAKTWEVNGWTNYQVRIISGTGMGQTRIISSNTATQLTVPAWTVTPDTTSVYVIEPNENYLYLLGNAAVTVYKHSVSANTWTVMAPTIARAAAPGLALSGDAVIRTGDAIWANESAIRDGRYIYSFRGGATAAVDRLDTAGGTAGAGAWLAVNYVGTQTFTTGSSYFVTGRYIFIKKEATGNIYKFSIRGNYLEPLALNQYTEGAAVLGNKIWVHDFDGTGTILWLYSVINSGVPIHRLMLI